MNYHQTIIQPKLTEELAIVKIKLPLNDTYQKYYSSLNMDFKRLKSITKDMIISEIMEYEKKLFSSCLKSMESFILQMLQNWTVQHCELRYVIRINPSTLFNGELIIEKSGQKSEEIFKNIIPPSKQLVNCYHLAELKTGESVLIINYILMRIIVDVNKFYQAKGRIFPAYIEIVI